MLKLLNKLYWGFALFFAGGVIAPVLAFAEETAEAAGGDSSRGSIAIAAAIVLAIPAAGGAIGQGNAARAALEGVARNPNASGKLLVQLILSLALIESLVIYALLIAFTLSGKL